ncbi:MAG: penicillin-binding protein activator [Rhodobacteraceae bacterium]|nr:penicillin-binding protein activator [Paracoccaceae bacterium]
MAVPRHLVQFFTSIAFLVAVAFVLSACIDTGPASQGPRVNTDKPVVVGLLVPSGSGNEQQEALADSLVRAARLAVSEMDDVKIDLKVYSTGGNAAQAAAAAKQASSDGAKILVGPLFAEAANSAGAAVAGRGINVLSFSNNPQIAGGNVFILGDTFQNTANRIVSHSVARGKRNIGAIVRADSAGEIAIASIQSAAARSGASYIGATRYELNTESVISAVSGARSLVRSSGANALVLDADSAGALPVFAQLLPENGITAQSVQLLGLTRWDQTSEQVRTNPGLQGSIFAMPDSAAQAAFKQRYSAANGGNPHILAGKAYDGLKVVGTLLRSGESDALTRTKITRPAGFSGANGIFRLLPDGTNQRGLAIATLREGQVIVIDPAPRGFGGAGS